MEEEAPLVRIADALEHIAKCLDKMANPPLMMRMGEHTVDFGTQLPGVAHYVENNIPGKFQETGCCRGDIGTIK